MLLLELLGRRWSLRILWELRKEPLTFRELQTKCDDVSPTSLNQRLKDLRDHNLVKRTKEGYGLTVWGEKVGEHLLSLSKISSEWSKKLG